MRKTILIVSLITALYITGVLYSVGALIAPGGITIGSGGPLDASAGIYTRLKTGVLASRPANCTAGDLYFITDAAAGSNWSGCTTTGTPGTWSILSGGGGGTINSGAGNGWTMMTKLGYQAAAASTISFNVNRGHLIQHLNDVQTEWRKAYLNITTADAAGSVKLCVWNAGRTSIIAESSILSTAATGIQSVTWSSGSQVSGGVFTLPVGISWYALTSDSATAQDRVMTGTDLAAQLQTEGKAFYTNTTISSGTGGTLACTGNISDRTAANLAQIPWLAFTN